MSKNFFKVSGRTEVANVKRQFLEKFKISIRFYNGDKLADDKDTLAYLQPKRAKKLEDMNILGHMQVRNLENRLLREYGLKVEFAKEDGSELPHKEVSLRNVLVGNFEHVRKKPTAKSDNVSGDNSGDNLEDFSDDNGKWGFKDKETGKVVIEPKYDLAWNFNEGLAKFLIGEKYGFIDTTGKVVIELKYDNADSFENGLAKVELNGKYGYIDPTGKEVIEIKYDTLGHFSNGLAEVFINDKWGFIDTTGNIVIEPIYDRVYGFQPAINPDFVAAVSIGHDDFYIDENGDRVEPEWEEDDYCDDDE